MPPIPYGYLHAFHLQSMIPDSEKEKALEMHKALVEAAAENDETLMEKFFESESLTEDEMCEGIRKGLATRGMFPVFCVCAGKDMGFNGSLEEIKRSRAIRIGRHRNTTGIMNHRHIRYEWNNIT